MSPLTEAWGCIMAEVVSVMPMLLRSSMVSMMRLMEMSGRHG